MTAISTLISAGGGGSEINEIKFFTDRGSSFTDSNGQVWLKAGAKTVDVTTYPDADSGLTTLSFSSDYQAAESSSTSMNGKGLSLSSDNVWALNLDSGTQIRVTDLATGTVSHFTPYNGFNPAGVGYVKAAASSGLTTPLSNANGYFMGVLGGFNGTSLLSFHLIGGSGTDAGKSNGLQAWLVLRDPSGTGLNASPYNYTATTQPAAFHWNPATRYLYVMFASSTTRCHLFIYNMSGNDWGNINAGNGTSTQLNASSFIDWQTQSGANSIYHMSGSSTHLYVHYRNASYTRNIRKIPLSGNLSWASGTDVGTSNSGLLQNADGTFSTLNFRDYPVYYRTAGSTEKFLVHDNPNNKLHEITLDVPIIGQAAWDYRRAQTPYQRIK